MIKLTNDIIDQFNSDIICFDLGPKEGVSLMEKYNLEYFKMNYKNKIYYFHGYAPGRSYNIIDKKNIKAIVDLDKILK